MKKTLILAMAAGLASLTACNSSPREQAADNIEAMTENRADALDAQADATGNEQVSDMLEDKADNVREMGDDAADKADDNDDARVEQQVKNQL